MKVIALLGLLVLMSGVLFSNQAFAEPLDTVKTSVSNYNGDSATVKISWNSDNSAKNYKIGCVSCTPNIVKYTSSDDVTLNNITPFPNGSYAIS
jgi:hypothetical protein